MGIDIEIPQGYTRLDDDATGTIVLIRTPIVGLLDIHITSRPKAVDPPRRRGPVSAEDSAAKRMALLSLCRKHPTARDDAALLAILAGKVGISAHTARRWLDQEAAAYLASAAAQPHETE